MRKIFTFTINGSESNVQNKSVYEIWLPVYIGTYSTNTLGILYSYSIIIFYFIVYYKDVNNGEDIFVLGRSINVSQIKYLACKIKLSNK